MSIEMIDASMMKKCFLAGAKALEAKKEYINELNVFPVPDGDTGTNMTMTIMAAVREVNKIENLTIDTLCKAMSSGSLRGARGNSGVILSQIFRGFTRELKGLEHMDVTDLGNGIQHAADTAYKAVMKPKEGTILTVIKAGAERSIELLMEGEANDMVAFAEEVVSYMEETLAKTPDMLPVLKQAGVVDSGGEGLMTFVRGALDALKGKVVDYSISDVEQQATPAAATGSKEAEDIEFGYCTEFIIMLEKAHGVVERELKAYLQGIGDCVVVVADDDIVKVHVHTNDPGLAIQKALTYGSLTSIKIDNMREEHEEKLIRDAESIARREKEAQAETLPETERKETGFIAVSVGDGLKDIFLDLGADYLIEGGQTMNPSTEDILEAIEKVNADTIYILPNNGNIILAAEQAKELTEDKEIIVIPSKNIPQGITAMINYVPGQSAQENASQMISEMEKIKSGQVTYAVRDTNMDGKEIKQGDFMGLTDKTILAVGQELETTTLELTEGMLDEDSELISLYYGAEVTEEEAEDLADKILDNHPNLEVEVQFGGQPIYSYFISVE
ncbi:MAG: DAK2 domain-containing protein [Lachnospiraceae bacterium]|nr:DAK2 domain-containing protein [Lachnospiraceae bacterium]